MSVQLPRRRFTVKDYYNMAKAGILTEDERACADRWRDH